jgi:predicted NodU family carbamoyl transferase
MKGSVEVRELGAGGYFPARQSKVAVRLLDQASAFPYSTSEAEAVGGEVNPVGGISDLLAKRVREEYGSKAVKLFPHHLCHAASVCELLPPDALAKIIVYDGMARFGAPSIRRP